MTAVAPRQRVMPGAIFSVADMEARLVRYSDLRPCYNAFIDTRSPGSEAKENFTIIGRGVAESSEQFVHITEPHGFNIGGARQPPKCVNSQHSHDTEEVFVVHSGTWRFNIGENGEDVQVILGPGDVITLPTNMFRGFTNIGDDVGYLFAILGGDDAGHVLWAPYVFDMAQNYGLVLLESGELIDTVAGQKVPDGAKVMPRTTPERVAKAYLPTRAEAESLIWRSEDLSEACVRPIIGDSGPFDWDHGFILNRVDLTPGSKQPAEAVQTPEVLFVQAGNLLVSWSDGQITMGKGDTLTLPLGLERQLSSQTGAAFYQILGTAE
jgi:mannose-6-phosphate isomerase-like protein (cupin superfamily)